MYMRIISETIIQRLNDVKSKHSRISSLVTAGAFLVAFPVAVIGNVALPAVVHANVLQAICDNRGGTNTECLNRNGGGHTIGSTAVIGWHNDSDNNEDFVFQKLTGMCGGGYVTSSCPFTVGSGFNNDFINDEIVQLQDTTYNDCLGGLSSNDTLGDYYQNGVLEKCNTPSTGSGGGQATIFAITSSGQDGLPADVLVNRYWTDFDYNQVVNEGQDGYAGPAFLCDGGFGSGVDTGLDGIPNGGACQWSTY
jgi:hypothetical protein